VDVVAALEHRLSEMRALDRQRPPGGVLTLAGEIAYSEWVLRQGTARPGRRLVHPLRRRRQPRGHGNCYENAGSLVFSTPEKYKYAEGFALHGADSFLLQHAWCVDVDGVVDVTWASPDECAYIGVEVGVEHMAEALLKANRWRPWGPW
jgi:hypothetical protein